MIAVQPQTSPNFTSNTHCAVVAEPGEQLETAQAVYTSTIPYMYTAPCVNDGSSASTPDVTVAIPHDSTR